MFAYAVRRILISIPVLVIASAIVFGLVATIDPLGELRANPNTRPEQIDRMERELGLDEPIPERYVEWLGGVVTGDFGRSNSFGQPVSAVLADAIPVTLRLVVAASVLSVIIGVAIGVGSALRQYGLFDNVSTFFAFLFFAMPTFWLAALLKDLAVRFNEWQGRRIFFTVGEETPRLDAGFLGTWSDRIGHLILPSLTLILIQMAATSRFQRSAMLDVLSADYVRTARAKGVPRRKVITRHALRNALLPVVSYAGVTFGALIAGAIITETVFSWRGMGRVFIEGLYEGDTNLTQAWLLVTAVSVVAVNLVTDLLYGYLDPRIRRD